jgi:hypothetical protein
MASRKIENLSSRLRARTVGRKTAKNPQRNGSQNSKVMEGTKTEKEVKDGSERTKKSKKTTF